jgi:hypothetical protein
MQEDAHFPAEQYRTLLEVSESIASHRDLSDLVQDLAEWLRWHLGTWLSPGRMMEYVLRHLAT